MAKRNYLVEGLSGAGKSSVYEELIRRGYKAISTDRAWAYHADPDTGLPGGPIHHDNFMWDQQKAVSELESLSPPGFRGDGFGWFPTFINGARFGTYRLACCRSYSAGGMPPSEVCRRSLLNQATYSTTASSSCERLRQTRSRISSVLKLSMKLSAAALS